MLRIFKKTSPMNHGAWALSGYGLVCTLHAALARWPASRLPFGHAFLRLLQRVLPPRLVSVLGLPAALTMISYPGVLLETTSNPVWAHSNFLGPLFAASSMSNGPPALTLLNLRSKDPDLHHRLTRFEDVSSAAEAAALALYAGTARKAARPLVTGRQSSSFSWARSEWESLRPPSCAAAARRCCATWWPRCSPWRAAPRSSGLSPMPARNRPTIPNSPIAMRPPSTDGLSGAPRKVTQLWWMAPMRRGRFRCSPIQARRGLSGGTSSVSRRKYNRLISLPEG